jgi:Flp pilus assembly protein TadG
MSLSHHDIKSERGQSMTELAMILPLLLILIFGIIQLGLAFNNYLAVTDAIRAGARKATVSRLSSDPAGDCVTAARNAGADLQQSKFTVTCASTWQPGADVTVTGSYPYSINVLGFVVKSGNLTTQVKERVE